uniref:Uncharacterized protein n=1 Tax=Romanomermis culicivorax TaxID=13658 RepID=A0A915JTZ2_ROMCU
MPKEAKKDAELFHLKLMKKHQRCRSKDPPDFKNLMSKQCLFTCLVLWTRFLYYYCEVAKLGSTSLLVAH